MSDEVQNTENGEQSASQQIVDGGLDKFMENGSLNVEKLKASYLELQSKNTKEAQAAAGGEETKTDESKNTAEQKESLTAQIDTEKKDEVTGNEVTPESLGITGEKMRPFVELYYERGGQFTDEDYAKIQSELNADREVTDNYISGLQAKGEKFNASLFESAGLTDETVRSQVFEWCIDNAEVKGLVDRFNEASFNFDSEAASAFLNQIHQQYRDSNSDAQKEMVRGEAGGDGEADVFRSREEIQTALSDPRAKPGPSFDQKYVEGLREKVRRSGKYLLN